MLLQQQYHSITPTVSYWVKKSSHGSVVVCRTCEQKALGSNPAWAVNDIEQQLLAIMEGPSSLLQWSP